MSLFKKCAGHVVALTRLECGGEVGEIERKKGQLLAAVRCVNGIVDGDGGVGLVGLGIGEVYL